MYSEQIGGRGGGARQSRQTNTAASLSPPGPQLQLGDLHSPSATSLTGRPPPLSAPGLGYGQPHGSWAATLAVHSGKNDVALNLLNSRIPAQEQAWQGRQRKEVPQPHHFVPHTPELARSPAKVQASHSPA